MKKNLLFILLISLSSLFSQNSENIDLIYNWDDNSITPAYDLKVYNEVWGYTKDGREYAFIGSTWGTHIFDVTDLNNVVYIDSIPGKQQGEYVIHRDYHDYEGYLYAVCDEGSSSLQIIDLHYLPDSVVLVYDTNLLIQTAHNIFIDIENHLLYAAGTNGFYPMKVFSLENNPLSPELVYEFFETTEVHDIYVRDNVAFVNAGTSFGLQIFYFLDPANPYHLSSLTDYEDLGYNHSGWQNDDGSIYIFADETYGKRLKLCRTNETYTEIEIVSLFGSEENISSMPHNVIIKNDIVYVSYYEDGLYMFEISNPDTPTMIGHYDTYYDSDYQYNGAWGVYPFLPSGNVLVSDREKGLMIFNVEDALAKSDSILSVDINEIIPEINSFNISPIPFNNKININFNLNSIQEIEVDILDFYGKIVYSKKNTKYNDGDNSILIENLELTKGVYFVDFIIGNETIKRKILKY